MIDQKEIKEFLEGNDPEEHIVAVEFDYASDSIYKIKEIPGKGKEIRKDTFIAFCWVGDLKGLNFYNNSKAHQKEAMSQHGIVIEKLDTHGDERMEKGLTFMVKCLKGYRSLIQFFRDGGAVDLYKGSLFPGTVEMNGACDHLLSGPGLPRDQNRCF